MVENPIHLSVIIPTYNRPEQLKRCISALALQDYPKTNFEVIVVDDGSPSPLDSIVSEFSDRLHLRFFQQPNAGPAAARNNGARNAKGEYFVFTDDDCIPESNWLSILKKRFEQEPECMLGGQTFNYLPQNAYSTASQMIIDFLYEEHNKDPQNAGFFTGNHIGVPAKGFHEISGFKEELFPVAAGEDRDFCARWLKHNRRMVYVPEAVIYHRNELTMVTFYMQQFNYGRVAFQFLRRMKHNQPHRNRTEPFSYYINLILYPFKKINGIRAIFFVFLTLMSQTAIFMGFCFEGFRSVKLYKHRTSKRRRNE